MHLFLIQDPQFTLFCDFLTYQDIVLLLCTSKQYKQKIETHAKIWQKKIYNAIAKPYKIETEGQLYFTFFRLIIQEINNFIKIWKDGASAAWWLYHIALVSKNGKLARDGRNCIIQYKGITNDLVNRLRQHCGIISGGARSTSRKIKAHPGCSWMFINFTGPFYVERDVKQFEPACKPKGKKFRTSQLDLTFRKTMEQELTLPKYKNKPMNRYILDTIETLNCNPWVPKGRDTSKIPLTIFWCMPEMRSPNLYKFLPTSGIIQERILTSKQQDKMFTLSTKSKPWVVFPNATNVSY